MDTPHPPPLDTQKSALFLDFDGTLVGFAEDPEAVALPAAGRHLVEALRHELADALVLVTGREIASLDRLIAPLRPATGGLHGLEVREWPGGPVRRLPVSEQVAVARGRLIPLVDATPGLRFEDKQAALVLHFRGFPELSDKAKVIAGRAAEGLDDLVVVPGHSIYEIRMGAVGKGEVVRRFMGKPGFAGRTPVFIGDDRTDEDGFIAAENLDGYAIKVGGGDTCAKFRLPDVASVHEHLRRAVSIRDGKAPAIGQ